MLKPHHPDVWRVEVTAPLATVEVFETVLERFTDAVSWFLDDFDADETDEKLLWRLEGYSRTPVSRTEIETSVALASASLGVAPPVVRIDQVPGTDWVLQTLRAFPPIIAGRFFVHGSHFEGKPPAGSVGIQIDAGTAFGSGEHATTFGCLTALDRLLRRRRFRRPLDLGCGSGILAIAAAKVCPVAVRAADIDPVSVLVARRNARVNGVGARITTQVSTGYRTRGIAEHGPYDLILANILARPLASMAHALGRNLQPNGVAVLSGLLHRHERYVLAAHRAQGLALLGRVRVNGWSTLVLTRRPRGRL